MKEFEIENLPNEHVEVEITLDADVPGFIVERTRGDEGTLGEHDVIAQLRERELVTSPADGVDQVDPAAAPVLSKARAVFGKARELGACGPLSVTLIVNTKG